MKRILLITTIFIQAFCVFAQKHDTSTVDCYYRLTFIKDTIDNISAEDIMILRLNKNKSIFFSENSYQLDSLLLSDKGDAIRMDILANGSGKYDKGVVSYSVLKDFSGKKLTFTDNVGGNHMKYEEIIPQFNWKLTNNRKKIGDYSCQKAICNFRGRTYEAWFTTEIPINNGPWKFHGLPGLIMEVYDTHNQYKFEFVFMDKKRANITLLPRDYISTTRDKYLKALKNYIKDPVGYISSSSGLKINLKGNARAKMKAKGIRYNPMELK